MSALRIGVLAYPGCFASEVYGIPDVLRMASHLAGSGGSGYEVSVVSPRGRVFASGGVRLSVVPLRPLDVLVVPGFECVPGVDIDEVLAPLSVEVAAITAQARAGTAVVSICVGAFLLARAGLLDDRSATTSWLYANRLAEMSPTAAVVADRLVVTDRGVTTTAAFSAMYDCALDLIRRRDGPRVARTTARITLLDDARSSQAPYVDDELLPRTGDNFVDQVMRTLDREMSRPYDLTALAARFQVSSRTLLRRFAREAGQSPLDHLQAGRVRRARHLLEETDQTVAVIAASVGYRNAASFATLFTQHTGQRPSAYRRTFRRDAPAAPDGPVPTARRAAPEG